MSESIHKAESSFESVFNNVNEGILISNAKGEIILANPKCFQMFGYDPGELEGRVVEDLVPQEIREKHVAYRAGYIEKPLRRPMGKNFILKGQRKDGSRFPVEISLSYYHTNEGMYVIAFIIDISIRFEQQERIQKINDDLRILNETLEKKVSERTLVIKEALHELENSRDELSQALEKEKQLNEMKSRFISMASHEFRTPLSTILSSASLIGRYIESQEPEKGEKHIARIKAAVNGLTEILNDFLSIGRLEEGKVKANPQHLDVVEAMESIVSELQEIAKADQLIRLNCTGKRDFFIDKHILRNIAINLIANAIKFSDPGKWIHVDLEINEEELILVVKDNGIGISEEDKEHLFERFYRGRNASNIQGTGLGLNIVLRYIEMLNGTIEFESELNEGTTFTLTFPAKYEDL